MARLRMQAMEAEEMMKSHAGTPGYRSFERHSPGSRHQGNRPDGVLAASASERAAGG